MSRRKKIDSKNDKPAPRRRRIVSDDDEQPAPPATPEPAEIEPYESDGPVKSSPSKRKRKVVLSDDEAPVAPSNEPPNKRRKGKNVRGGDSNGSADDAGAVKQSPTKKSRRVNSDDGVPPPVERKRGKKRAREAEAEPLDNGEDDEDTISPSGKRRRVVVSDDEAPPPSRETRIDREQPSNGSDVEEVGAPRRLQRKVINFHEGEDEDERAAQIKKEEKWVRRQERRRKEANDRRGRKANLTTINTRYNREEDDDVNASESLDDFIQSDDEEVERVGSASGSGELEEIGEGETSSGAAGSDAAPEKRSSQRLLKRVAKAKYSRRTMHTVESEGEDEGEYSAVPSPTALGSKVDVYAFGGPGTAAAAAGSDDDDDEWVVHDDEVDDGEQVRCVCGATDADTDPPAHLLPRSGRVEWVRCSSELCGVWQHSVCVEAGKKTKRFLCDRCTAIKDGVPIEKSTGGGGGGGLRRIQKKPTSSQDTATTASPTAKPRAVDGRPLPSSSAAATVQLRSPTRPSGAKPRALPSMPVDRSAAASTQPAPPAVTTSTADVAETAPPEGETPLQAALRLGNWPQAGVVVADMAGESGAKDLWTREAWRDIILYIQRTTQPWASVKAVVEALGEAAARATGDDHPLVVAASQGQEVAVTRLEYLVPPPNNATRGRALKAACRVGDAPCVISLIKAITVHRAMPQQLTAGFGADGSSAIHAAAQHGHVEVLRRLMEHMANYTNPAKSASSPDKAAPSLGFDWSKPPLSAHGETPLHSAAMGGNLECIKILMAVWRDALEHEDMEGNRAIHVACEYGHSQAVRMLQNFGASSDARTKLKEYPLHKAALSGSVPTATQVLRKSAVTAENATPLHYAARANHGAMIEFLLQQTEDRVGGRDREGATPLHRAAQNNATRAIEVLVKRGAPVDARDAEGSTALHYAASEGHIDACQALIRAGASVSAPDSRGWPPILYAEMTADDETIFTLLGPSADNLGGLGALLTDATVSTRVIKIVRWFATEPSCHKNLNVFIANNIPLLDTSCAFLLRAKDILTFDNKCRYFRHKVGQIGPRFMFDHMTTLIMVTRGRVLEELIPALLAADPVALREGPQIIFRDEAGIGPGVRREVFSLASRDIAQLSHIFERMPDGSLAVMRTGTDDVSALTMLRGIGCLVGSAIAVNNVLDVHFNSVLLKFVLGRPLEEADLTQIDPEFYKNLQWMLSNPVEDLGLTFAVNQDTGSGVESVDLRQNGRNIAVTDSNKAEYVRLNIAHRLGHRGGLDVAFSAFRDGIAEVIPLEYLALFNEAELDQLIGGSSDIDVASWRAATQYQNYLPDSPQVEWFWALVERMPPEERAMLLKFATGSPRPPPGGFVPGMDLYNAPPFTIARLPTSPNIPTASTCFNLFKLPAYPTRDMLEKKVLVAVRYGLEGFAFS